MDWVTIVVLMAVAVGGLGWLMSGGRGGVREHVSEVPRTFQYAQPTDSMEMLRRTEDDSWAPHKHHDRSCGFDSGSSHSFWGGSSDHGSSSSSSSSSSS